MNPIQFYRQHGVDSMQVTLNRDNKGYYLSFTFHESLHAMPFTVYVGDGDPEYTMGLMREAERLFSAKEILGS